MSFIHSSFKHKLTPSSWQSASSFIWIYFDLICLCHLRDHQGTPGTQPPLSSIPSINLHTLPCLPSLTPSFLINHFMISGLQQWAWSVAQIYILVTWSFASSLGSCPFGATWQHFYSAHASLCLSLLHEISQPWGCTLSVCTPVWVHLKLHPLHTVQQ